MCRPLGSWILEVGARPPRLDCTSSSLESIPCPLTFFFGAKVHPICLESNHSSEGPQPKPTVKPQKSSVSFYLITFHHETLSLPFQCLDTHIFPLNCGSFLGNLLYLKNMGHKCSLRFTIKIAESLFSLLDWNPGTLPNLLPSAIGEKFRDDRQGIHQSDLWNNRFGIIMLYFPVRGFMKSAVNGDRFLLVSFVLPRNLKR
ncbi:hypothetical protein STEG23_011672 [Scotinomys teguina]